MRIVAIMLLGVLLIGLPAGTVLGETYTFQMTNDVWGHADHWDPDDGPPGAGDTAIIPSGKTCRVEDGDQTAKIIDVQLGGTLAIIGRQLTLGVPEGLPVVSTVNGTMIFKKSAGTPGTLRALNFVQLDGSGTLNASKGDDPDYEGRIVDGLGESGSITVEAGVTVKGSFEILLAYENNGTLLVDHPDDDMRLGLFQTCEDPDRFNIFGKGTYKVSAGKMRFGCVKVTSVPPGSTWEVAGGEMEFTEFALFPGPFLAKFVVSGGTLDIDVPLVAERGITWSGGRIEVAEGLSIPFTFVP